MDSIKFLCVNIERSIMNVIIFFNTKNHMYTTSWQVYILEAPEYSEERYSLFKRTWKAPEEMFDSYQWELDTGKIGYCDAYFMDIEKHKKFFRLCKKPKKTFISEGLKNWSLSLL